MNYPYLILSIDEFKSDYIGTNLNIDNAFAIVGDPTNSSPLQITGLKNYTSLLTINGGIKTFYPGPLSSLNKLTIKLLKPNGDLYCNEKDNLVIKKIYGSETVIWDNDQFNYLILIEFDKFFDPQEYIIGDNILIKNLKIPQSTPNYMNYNNFFNDIKGHRIIGTTSTKQGLISSEAPFHPPAPLDYIPDTNYANAIIIQAPIDNNKLEQGLNVSFCLYDWYTSSNGSLLNIDFNNLGTINEIKEKYFDNNIVNQQCDVADKYLGKILNLDMQPIFCFKVKTFETDTNSLVENKNC